MPKSTRVRDRNELQGMTDQVTLNRAFQLAHSIYRFKQSERRVALSIVSEALIAVDVRLAAQHEADRHDPQKPTKVRWNTLQWLQLLIYYKSEAHEKQQEIGKNSLLSEEDMIVRYIKHLILTTCRRNSFHISLGLSRLLYDYSAAETMAIYDLTFQDPDSSTRKADAYYRGRKNKLIEELQMRFQRFLRIDQGARGEKRFQSREDSSRFGELVNQYLTRFTPWETRCELPRHLDTWTAVRSLQSSQPSQIHSLIHPLCFSRITEALKLDPPEKRLTLPKFFLTRSQSDNEPRENNPSELTIEEATAVRERIADEERRRKRFSPRSLSILADGIERWRLYLDQSSQVRFDLENDITLIELMGHDEEGELLLAAHLLTGEEDDPTGNRSTEYAITLEGDQKLSLTILPASAGTETVTSSIEVRYQETRALRATALWGRQFSRRLLEKDVFKRWQDIPVLSFKWALALVALILTTAILYILLRSGPSRPQHIAQQQPTPAVAEIPPHRATSSPTNATPERTPPSTVKPEASPLSDRSKLGETREQGPRGIKSLFNVEQIYVASMGDDAFSRNIQQKLIENLQANNRFVIAKGKDDADTAITGAVRLEGKRRDNFTGQDIEIGSVTFELVNISGDVIWRTRTFRGTADEVASQFTKALLAAMQRERRLPKK